MAKSYECTRKAWHNESHIVVRDKMKRIIISHVFRGHKPRILKNPKWRAIFPSFLIRIDDVLYCKANTIEEYADLSTIDIRLNDAVQTCLRKSDEEKIGNSSMDSRETSTEKIEDVSPRAQKDPLDAFSVQYDSSDKENPNSSKWPICMQVALDFTPYEPVVSPFRTHKLSSHKPSFRAIRPRSESLPETEIQLEAHPSLVAHQGSKMGGLSLKKSPSDPTPGRRGQVSLGQQPPPHVKTLGLQSWSNRPAGNSQEASPLRTTMKPPHRGFSPSGQLSALSPGLARLASSSHTAVGNLEQKAADFLNRKTAEFLERKMASSLHSGAPFSSHSAVSSLSEVHSTPESIKSRLLDHSMVPEINLLRGSAAQQRVPARTQDTWTALAGSASRQLAENVASAARRPEPANSLLSRMGQQRGQVRRWDAEGTENDFLENLVKRLKRERGGE